LDPDVAGGTIPPILLVTISYHWCERGRGGLRKPQLDGDLSRIRGGGELELFVRYCHDLARSHAIK